MNVPDASDRPAAAPFLSSLSPAESEMEGGFSSGQPRNSLSKRETDDDDDNDDDDDDDDDDDEKAVM